jgi:nucleotide-binding universal stress UspA family protein
MYSRVLIPLDGSSFAERILAYVDEFATPDQTEIILMQVVNVSVREVLGNLEPVADIHIKSVFEAAEKYLNQIRGELRQRGFRARVHLDRGDVAETICATADAQDVDLIAMTTHGRSGASRWLLGSIADRLIRSASQPIFLVRPTNGRTPDGVVRKILVPLDGSKLAELALPHAVAMAKRSNAQVILIQAIHELEIAPSDRVVAEKPPVSPQESAESYLRSVLADLRTKEGIDGEVMVREGHPAEVILQAAESEETDLIVMSTHGRSGLNRWVYGSVADKVLRQSPKPLLLIRSRVESERRMNEANQANLMTS